MNFFYFCHQRLADVAHIILKVASSDPSVIETEGLQK